MKKGLLLLTVLILFYIPGSIQAHKQLPRVFPFQLSIWHPIQSAPDSSSIYGLRLNLIYGANRHVTGLDLGIFNRYYISATGMQLGLINYGTPRRRYRNEGHFNGLQMALIANVTADVNGGQVGGLASFAGHVSGIQIGGLVSESRTLRGVQISGLMNSVMDLQGLQIALGLNYSVEKTAGVQFASYNYSGQLSGFQIGLINQTETGTGVQAGWMNIASKDYTGLQFGFINYARGLNGVQLGLINIIPDGPVPFMLIINGNRAIDSVSYNCHFHRNC